MALRAVCSRLNGRRVGGGRHSLNRQRVTASSLFQASDNRAVREEYSLASNRINAQAFDNIFDRFAPQIAYKHVYEIWLRFINAAIARNNQ